MWIITLCFAISLLVISFLYLAIRKKSKIVIVNTLKRAPWTLIPFIISMFVIVLGLSIKGLPEIISENVCLNYPIMGYGLLSFICSNIMNNIPMCVFFSKIISCLASSPSIMKITFSVIAGSNIGAFLTPIGALAGIMWMSILKKNEVEFSFFTFMKYGILISIPTIIIAILVIAFI